MHQQVDQSGVTNPTWYELADECRARLGQDMHHGEKAAYTEGFVAALEALQGDDGTLMELLGIKPAAPAPGGSHG